MSTFCFASDIDKMQTDYANRVKALQAHWTQLAATPSGQILVGRLQAQLKTMAGTVDKGLVACCPPSLFLCEDMNPVRIYWQAELSKLEVATAAGLKDPAQGSLELDRQQAVGKKLTLFDWALIFGGVYLTFKYVLPFFFPRRFAVAHGNDLLPEETPRYAGGQRRL